MKLSVLLFFVLVGFLSNATIVHREDISQMVESSEVIAHVVVGDQVQKIDEMGREVTLTSVEIIRALKGAKAGQIVQIFQLGWDNSQSMRIMGQSRFAIGEEMILFGMHHEDMIVSYGVGLGKFRVLRDYKNAKVVEELHDLVEVVFDKYGARVRAPISRHYAHLENFIEKIDASLNAPLHVIKTGPKAIRGRP